MNITGFGNLAAKVSDIHSAVAYFRSIGVSVVGPVEWRGSLKADVDLSGVALTLFSEAIYEKDEVPVPEEGFLHLALFTDDLDSAIEGQELEWGPAEVEGSFGKRRIAFVKGPGIRIELMEQLD
ncbi:MAG: hypothetical protein M1134_04275 [Actinobacteria bacterium]|jgi:catechol 2,3-dioxygenase-like lactoylglutathione lyase family enzyme|nr:hypothetical protein [Actinomycetota bacterium]MCL5444722.1 hypothetical protein [Actinomycetota bacterium]